MKSFLASRAGRSVDPDAVHAALATVEDPELRMPLTEAGMVGEVQFGRAGLVNVAVRLTTPSCPLKDELARRIVAAVSVVADVSAVEVSFEAMNELDRRDLAARLRGEQTRQRGPFGSSKTRIYAVASGKGGVGKSMVTANLATALAQQGQRVGVLDADVWGYSVPQLFGVRRAPVALKGLMLPIEAHGVQLMSVGFMVSDAEPVMWRGPMLHKAIEQFLDDVHWGELDVLLIDLPPGTGDVTMSLVELLPDAALVAVTTPQLAAQTVAERVGRMARNVRMPVAGVIENMTELVCDACGGRTALFGSGGGQRLADEIAAPLLGQVPLDVHVREAGDLGVPAVAHAPQSPAAVELSRIARHLPVQRRSLAQRPLPLSVV